MPPARRTRASGSISTSSPLDDINSLTLSEVRDRLVRNERVLGLNLFSSPPPNVNTSSNASPVPLSASPTSPDPRSPSPAAPVPGRSGPAGTGATGISIAGPSRLPHPPAWSGTSSPPLASSPTDPVRERLLQVRGQLLSRERELILAEAEHLSLDDAPAPESGPGEGGRRRSAGVGGGGVMPGAETSGKRRAMESMQAAEAALLQNGTGMGKGGGHFLPLAQTKALAERDFQSAAAADFGALSLTASSSPKPRRRRDIYPDRPPPASSPPLAVEAMSGGKWHPQDENARAEQLARLNAFMSYRGDPGEGDDPWNGGGAEGVDEMFDFDPQDGHYAGDGGRMEIPGPNRGLRERGTGEMVDEFGEDDEEWAEGNDEYVGDGYGSLGAGPDHR